MKVLMTYSYFSGKGGMETVITKVLNHANKDVKIEFLLTGGSDDTEWLKNINNKFGKVILHNHRSYPGVFIDTFDYIKKIKPDIVITLNNLQIMPIILAKKLFVPNMKIYAWPHFALQFFKGKKLLKYCDSYLAIASGIKYDLEKMGIKSDKIHLVYNPIDRVKKPIAHSKDNEVKHFIYVGRLEIESQKNISELYRILHNLKHNNWVLEVYGSGSDQNELKKLSKKLGIQDKIKYFGWQKDVWSKIKVADLVFLTSKFEGFGCAIAEAIAHGIPCIASNCPVGPNDIIKEGINGHLYEMGDIQDAVDTVDDFLEGKLKFKSSQQIQASANQFYTDVYINRLFNILKNS